MKERKRKKDHKHVKGKRGVTEEYNTHTHTFTIIIYLIQVWWHAAGENAWTRSLVTVSMVIRDDCSCASPNHGHSLPSAPYSSFYASLCCSFCLCIFRPLFSWLAYGRLSWWEFEPSGCIHPRSDSQEELGAASTHANATSAPDTPPTSTLQSSQSTAWDQLKWHQSEKERDIERDCKSA